MKIYRQRNIIEQGFQQLKNEVGGDRLRATETTYRGKIFLIEKWFGRHPEAELLKD